jgi:chromosomal replication initiation ATPase DnaA
MGLWASSTVASIGIYTDRNVTPLTVENFNTWLASTRVVAQEGNLLRIAVPRQFSKDWLEAKLNGRVMNTLARLGHQGVCVEYVVEVSA